MNIQAPRGTKDILPQEVGKWQQLEEIIGKICKNFGYFEIRTPVFENTELFQRGIGDDTDVVQKEMYTFEDKGGRSITLRPEGTASVVRSILENNLLENTLPLRLFYLIACYRYEKPQAGRLREFHQFGVEAFGSQDPYQDCEVIAVAVAVLNKLGLNKLEIAINSVGCGECKKEYNEALKNYFENKDICELCCSRLTKNPMRVLDCKNEDCQEIAKNAPKITDYLCDGCEEHFEKVQVGLKALNIDYHVDEKIVRGLDYYTKTVFEIVSGNIGAQSVVCGGGRYDKLVEEMEGKPTPAVGFGMGLERLLLALEQAGIELPDDTLADVYIGGIGDAGSDKAFELANLLRRQDVKVNLEMMGRSPKAQMKYADKINTRFAMLIGDDEIKDNKVSIKNMQNGETIETALNAKNILEAFNI